MGLSADILFFRTPDPEILETGLLPKNPRRPFVESLLDDLLRRPLRSQQNDLAGWIYLDSECPPGGKEYAV